MRWHSLVRASFIAAGLSATAAVTASAQARYQTLGPAECINCHDHQDDRAWYEKKEMPEVRRLFPDRGDKAGHINSLKQLDEKKGDPWAQAIGLKDKYDPKGACVRCHATVFQGEANAGVSCESCHGPSSGYLKPHQTAGAYDQSVALGMTKLLGNIQGWAAQCTSCHVMDDKRLVSAGHPSGNDFDLGTKFQPVSLHFKKKYAPADVGPIGRAQVQAILARRDGGSSSPTPTPVPPPPVSAPAAPAPTPSAPVASVRPPSTPAPVPPPAAEPKTAAEAPRPAPPAASTATRERPPNPAPPAAAPEPAASSPPARTAAPSVPPTVAAPAPQGSASAAVSLAQGHLIVALTDLLQSGAAAPISVRARTPLAGAYSGPDAALLKLQVDAIALALEAFGTAPVQPARATAPSRTR